jgi:hypothetical protein
VRLPEIEAFVRANDLRVIGLDVSDPVAAACRSRFPGDPTMSDLGAWHVFEAENPEVFVGACPAGACRRPATGPSCGSGGSRRSWGHGSHSPKEIVMPTLRLPALAVAFAAILLVGCANMAAAPGPTNLRATLSAAQEVPPVASQGGGGANIAYDPASRRLSWTVTFGGLTGPATAAHFHGPAAPGVNAGVAVPIGAAGMTSPVSGQATLTDAQAADLLAGRWYVNIHTAANPGGEIRGQVTR